jgi:hypothetical protein
MHRQNNQECWEVFRIKPLRKMICMAGFDELMNQQILGTANSPTFRGLRMILKPDLSFSGSTRS